MLILLDEITMKQRDKVPLVCTSDACKSRTMQHQALADGWFICLNCGCRRQKKMYQSGRFSSSPTSDLPNQPLD